MQVAVARCCHCQIINAILMEALAMALEARDQGGSKIKGLCVVSSKDDPIFEETV